MWSLFLWWALWMTEMSWGRRFQISAISFLRTISRWSRGQMIPSCRFVIGCCSLARKHKSHTTLQWLWDGTILLTREKGDSERTERNGRDGANGRVAECLVLPCCYYCELACVYMLKPVSLTSSLLYLLSTPCFLMTLDLTNGYW